MQKLAEICIRRPVFATMLIMSLTVVGIFSFFGLGVDLLPKVDVPTVSISVANPGASAEPSCAPHRVRASQRSSSLSCWRKTEMWRPRKFGTRST